MTIPYKLPRCWLGKQQSRDGAFHTITAEEVNMVCVCATPMEAFLCMEGHLTECHKGMKCADADCSHLSQYVDDDASSDEASAGEASVEDDCS